MKEIIYLDTEIMNSMLAQLDEGLVNSYTLESSNQETSGETTQTTRFSSGGLTAGVKVSTGFLPGGSLNFGSKKDSGGNESESYTTTILEGQKDILNKAFHDHALNILIDKLKVRNLINTDTNLKEGDLFFLESSFNFYDFNLFSKSMNVDYLKKFLSFAISLNSTMSYEEAKKIISKKNPSAREREKIDEARRVYAMYNNFNQIISFYEQLNSLGKFATDLLTDLSVIKAQKNIGLLKKKYLRESAESLSFRTDNSRKAKILFRVIGKKINIFDSSSVIKFTENDIDKMPNMMLDIILGSFKILEKEDVLVTPIAIYYE